MSTLSQLSTIAIASSAASVGWSGGRDVYRSLRQHAGLILLFCLAVAGSGVAAFFIRRGTHRGWVGTFFVLFLPNLLLLLASTYVATLFAFVVIGPLVYQMPALAWVIGYQVVAIVIGVLAANPVRRRSKREREVELHNERFLADIGFQNLGGRQGVWLDDQDRELIVHDRRRDALVFRILGKRNGRSAITIDGEGRMLRYLAG